MTPTIARTILLAVLLLVSAVPACQAEGQVRRLRQPWAELGVLDRLGMEAERDRLRRDLQGLEPAARFDLLSARLGANPTPWMACWIHLEIAALHEEVLDLREALRSARLAREADPANPEAARRVARLEDRVEPVAGPGERLRQWDKTRGLTLTPSLGLEYATNVVQEPVRPTVATGKKDTALVLKLDALEAWRRPLGPFRQESFYALGSYTYASHEELDMVNQWLEHRLLKDKAFGREDLDTSLRLSFNHVFSDARALMWSWELGAGAFLRQDRFRLLWDGNLSARHGYYLQAGSKGQEGDAYAAGLGVSRPLDEAGTRTLRLSLRGALEDTRDPAESYGETLVTLGLRQALAGVVLSSVAPELSWRRRDYDTSGAAGLPDRSDDQWSAGFGLQRDLGRNATLALDLSRLENRSNRADKHYRSTKAGLAWSVRF